MDVMHRLAGVRTGVENHPVASAFTAETLLLRDLMRRAKQDDGQLGVRHGQGSEVAVMCAGHNKDVDGRLRRDVAEGDRLCGLADYRGRDLPADQAAEQAIGHRAPSSTGSLPDRARRAVDLSGKPSHGGARRTRMSEALLVVPGSRALLGQFETATADEAVVDLYRAHYAGLVRLSAMLVGDLGTAEEAVQDAFVAMHGSWSRLRDPDKALAYLRQAVVNRSRSKLRHRAVVAKYPQEPPPDVPSAENYAIAAGERAEVLAALRALPRRQRETLVLRYYSDLSEAQIADTLGISPGAVKSHAFRGLAALRNLLEKTS